MSWTDLFEKHILERGQMYHLEGCVENPQVNDGEITAVVKGSEQYDVTIKLNKNEVIDMTCTCPYAETINANARNVADRAIYREWVSTLKHMRKIPGEKPLAMK